ncbi:MAG: DUF3619 family protein [Betaproteobacteria bacterium]
MNDDNLARNIATKLDQSLEDLSAGTVYRLRLAREAAIGRLHADASLPGAAAGAPTLLSRRILVPVMALILGLSGLFLLEQETPQKVDVAELDAQVLSDELPVTAYLDQGFETWLNHQSTE